MKFRKWQHIWNSMTATWPNMKIFKIHDGWQPPHWKLFFRWNFAYTYIAVTFQLRISINVRLTESSLYNRVCTKKVPQNKVLGWFWGWGEDIWWKSTSALRIARFQTSLLQSPDLMRRVLEFCMGRAICHRRNFGQVWGSQAPLPDVAGKLRCRKSPIWTFDYHMEKS